MDVMEIIGKDLSQFMDVAKANLKSIAIVFNVSGYDAKGDGVTDDAVAIQKALTAAGVNGGTVYFPAGVFLIGRSITIPSNVMLQGISPDVSIIKIKSNATLTGPSYGGTQKIITNDNPITAPFNKNITVDSIGFDGNGENQKETMSIAFGSVVNLRIQNCKFTNFGKLPVYNQGLVVFGGSMVFLTNNSFTFCSGDGVAIAEGTDQAIVVGNYFVSNHDYGIAVSNKCINVTVANNVVLSNGQVGIGVDECAGVVVTGNMVKFNLVGISFLRFFPNFSYPNEYYVCTGNNLRENAIGIGVNNTTMMVVSGNKISESSDKGIQMLESVECTVTGNDITNCNNEGILIISNTLGTNCGDSLISGNRVARCNWGIRELSVPGPIIESSIFSNRINNNAIPMVMVASRPENNDVQFAYGSLTWDPPSLAAGTGVTVGITVSGASIGDTVDVIIPYDISDCMVYGWVSDTNIVAIRVQNGTAAAVDLPSGVWKVRIRK